MLWKLSVYIKQRREMVIGALEQLLAQEMEDATERERRRLWGVGNPS